MLHSVSGQPDTASVDAQFTRVPETPWRKLPQVAAYLDAALAGILAFKSSRAATPSST
jgi:hypothetical protein